ncbi:MAG: GAF domain-containing protein [Nitrospinota bacterium]|nr:GAF domain-containing protein [Nitrospinota bacterium]
MSENKKNLRESDLTKITNGEVKKERRRENQKFLDSYARYFDNQIKKLSDIGIALSSEKNLDKLLEMILNEAMSFTSADAGTLYTKEGEALVFKIMVNNTFKTRSGGTSGTPITLPPVNLVRENVSAYSAITGETVNIPDVYTAKEFDFTGPRKYDAATGYKSTSMLVVPMKNQDNEIIGVLQLLNATDTLTETVIPFPDDKVSLTESLASQAAVAITNAQLIQGMENLFNSFVKVMATAIDERSPYTGGHIRRVAELGELMCDVINKSNAGKFKNITFTPEERKEILIAGWMHDVGKITTPVHIMDKSTKLETISDKVELVKARFMLIETVLRAEWLEKKVELLQNGNSGEEIQKGEENLGATLEELRDDLEFIVKSNTGGEFMSDDKVERIRNIGTKTFTHNGETSNYLSESEIENLSIRKGTLLESERKLMQDHVSVTLKMLNQIPFTKHLRNVPLFAGSHHECVDGSGYPLGLKGDDLPLGGRILNLVDFYEALSASDRPYKKKMPIEKVISILQAEADHGKIDSDLLALFLKERVWETYEKMEAEKKKNAAAEAGESESSETGSVDEVESDTAEKAKLA